MRFRARTVVPSLERRLQSCFGLFSWTTTSHIRYIGSMSADNVETQGWLRRESPIFQGNARDFLIRYSYFTLAPHSLPFARMEGFYRAYDRFARLVRNPANQRRFLLREGDYLIYDNHRMLHARTSFSGPRWMRGVYFNPRVGT